MGQVEVGAGHKLGHGLSSISVANLVEVGNNVEHFNVKRPGDYCPENKGTVP